MLDYLYLSENQKELLINVCIFSPRTNILYKESLQERMCI